MSICQDKIFFTIIETKRSVVFVYNAKLIFNFNIFFFYFFYEINIFIFFLFCKRFADSNFLDFFQLIWLIEWNIRLNESKAFLPDFIFQNNLILLCY